jgi:YVTN family beta-propeller protein
LKKRLIVSFVCLLLLVGCEMKPLQLKPPLDGDGEVFLYLDPFPQEAEPLRFSLTGIFALKADGTEVPLELSLQEFKTSELKRQRLVASGRLPYGSYSGLSFAVGSARLKGEEGEGDLIIPKEPAKINFLFTVRKGKAVVIAMNFRYAQSLRNKVSFIPFFSLSIPDRPLLGLKGFVSNHDSNTVTVFDKRDGRVASVIETGGGPGGIALDQRARRAYVALSEDDAIDVIDVDSGDTINRLNLTTGDKPAELALTPDGSTLLTVNKGSDSVSIINPVTLLELKRITVGNNPASILLDRTGRKAYVFNLFSNSISIIDVRLMELVSTFTTETGPVRGQFNRRGDRLYVFYERSPYLTVLDPFSFSVIKRVFVGPGVSDLKVDTDTDMLFLSRRRDSGIEIYDPFSFLPIETFDAGDGVDYMTIDNEGNNLCLVLPDKKRLVFVNLVSRKVVSELDTGDYPYWVTMMGER